MLCLDDLQARFHYLSPELDRIFRESTTPRKLDVQKLRTAMKNIFKDLVLTRSVMSKEQPWCYTASRSSVQESHATSLDGELKYLHIETVVLIFNRSISWVCVEQATSDANSKCNIPARKRGVSLRRKYLESN